MKVQIKDKDNQILTGLKAAGFKMDNKIIETILNIIDFIRDNKKDTTLKDILEIQELIESLYKD